MSAFTVVLGRPIGGPYAVGCSYNGHEYWQNIKYWVSGMEPELLVESSRITYKLATSLKFVLGSVLYGLPI